MLRTNLSLPKGPASPHPLLDGPDQLPRPLLRRSNQREKKRWSASLDLAEDPDREPDEGVRDLLRGGKDPIWSPDGRDFYFEDFGDR